MTPVINPWVFYLISITDKLGVVAWVLFGVFGVFSVGFIISLAFEYSDFGESESFLSMKKTTKVVTAIACVALILAVFIPGSDTITKMVVAQNVTYERVEVAGDIVQDVYEDIIGLFDDSGESDG